MTQPFVVADPATGEIRLSGACQASDIALQGENVVAGAGSNGTHYVVGGALVAYTFAQSIAKATRPDHRATWSNQTMAWTDERTIEEQRAVKWAKIKRARDSAEFGGFTINGYTFDSDAASVLRISGAVQMASFLGPNFAMTWTLADNSTLHLGSQPMFDVGIALGQHVEAVHAQARKLRAAIEAAQTVEELEAIIWQ